jgi:hypothetical protein
MTMQNPSTASTSAAAPTPGTFTERLTKRVHEPAASAGASRAGGWQPEGDPVWTLLRVLSLGLLHPERDPRQPVVSPAVGRFNADFDPRAWRPQAPNTAFDRMTPTDLRWIAERIGRLGPPQIEAIVAAAELSDPADARYLVEILLAHRERILGVYRKTLAEGADGPPPPSPTPIAGRQLARPGRTKIIFVPTVFSRWPAIRDGAPALVAQ